MAAFEEFGAAWGGDIVRCCLTVNEGLGIATKGSLEIGYAGLGR